MEVRLRALTPLWTGGVDGEMDRVHETGILGSLRWWYETIVRGLGGNACDPTGKSKCEYDPKDSRPPEEQLCPACYVFGTTGWRRRFRLEVEDKTVPIWEPPERMLNIRPPDRKRGWYLPPGRMGMLRLQLRGDAKMLSLLAALFLFLERWGTIGAKSQLGYGIFELTNREEIKKWALGTTDDKSEWQWEAMGNQSPNAGLPDLRQFGFFRYRFSGRFGWWTHVPGFERVASRVQPLVRDYKTVPVAPALKNEWRFYRWQRKWGDEREVFGTLRPSRRRSKVAVSWAYPVDEGWEVRGWIWLSNKRWADKAWKVVCDIESWQAVMKVEGELEMFRVNTQQEVLNLLEATT